MKWNEMAKMVRGRGAKALGASLAVGLGMTACSRDYTVAYVYVTAATQTTSGSINAYAVDYQSGALTPLADSPIPSGGNDPVSLVASPNAKNVYVINQAAPSSNVVEFSIGSDGKLYPENTYAVVQNPGATVVGSFPTAIAIDPTGKFLYITFTYQNGYSATSPGPGGIAIYPINSDGSLGTPLETTTANGSVPYVPVGHNPAGIVVSPKGGFVYVIDQEKTSSGTPYGVLLAFTMASNGALTPVAGPVNNGFQVGTTPGGIAEDPTGTYLYITDETTNQLYGFSVALGGAPATLPQGASPVATGDFPIGVTVDPRGEYVYVANFGSSTVSAFAINQGSGILSSVAGSAGSSVGTSPTCVAIEPALGIYLYTSNNVGNTVSGEQLKPQTGALTQVQGSPFPTAALPTCAVAVPNGAHATQIVDSPQS
jgi:DNA-binding beta-propeller fold protein YncE